MIKAKAGSGPGPFGRIGPGARFALRFGMIATGLYLLLLTPVARDHLWDPHLRLTARAAAATLQILGQSVTVDGRLILGDSAAIEVRRGCDAIEPSELLWAATLAFPAAAAHRVVGIMVGTLLLQLLNVGRVAGLFAVRSHFPEQFDLFHVELGQVGFILVAVGIWVAWMEWVSRRGLRTAET